MIPLGISIGISVRVATLLGAGDIPTAKLVTKMALVVGVVAAFLVSVLIYFAQNPIIAMFTNDPEVIAVARSLWTDVSIFIFVGIPEPLRRPVSTVPCTCSALCCLLRFTGFTLVVVLRVTR